MDTETLNNIFKSLWEGLSGFVQWFLTAKVTLPFGTSLTNVISNLGFEANLPNIEISVFSLFTASLISAIIIVKIIKLIL